MAEIFFSIDIETDGPIPGVYSMLNFGVVAFNDQGQEIGTFEVNLEPLAEATQHPETMAWWNLPAQQKAWQYVSSNQQNPKQAMEEFVKWAETFKRSETGQNSLVAMAYPAGFDWTFLLWYMVRFVGRSPFKFQCLDMKTLAAEKLNLPFKKAIKKNFPKEWFDKSASHTHTGLDDAREQGLMFFKMKSWKPPA